MTRKNGRSAAVKQRPCCEHETKARQWQALALKNARARERSDRALRAQHRLELDERDAVIARLQRELEDAREYATRKQGPSMLEVVNTYTEELRHHDSQKETLFALQKEQGWNERMVRRRLLEFQELVARSMGLTLAQLRDLRENRPPRSPAPR